MSKVYLRFNKTIHNIIVQELENKNSEYLIPVTDTKTGSRIKRIIASVIESLQDHISDLKFYYLNNISGLRTEYQLDYSIVIIKHFLLIITKDQKSIITPYKYKAFRISDAELRVELTNEVRQALGMDQNKQTHAVESPENTQDNQTDVKSPYKKPKILTQVPEIYLSQTSPEQYRKAIFTEHCQYYFGVLATKIKLDESNNYLLGMRFISKDACANFVKLLGGQFPDGCNDKIYINLGKDDAVKQYLETILYTVNKNLPKIIDEFKCIPLCRTIFDDEFKQKHNIKHVVLCQTNDGLLLNIKFTSLNPNLRTALELAFFNVLSQSPESKWTAIIYKIPSTFINELQSLIYIMETNLLINLCKNYITQKEQQPTALIKNSFSMC